MQHGQTHCQLSTGATGWVPSSADILSGESHEQPSSTEPQLSLAPGEFPSAAAGGGPASTTMPPAQPAGSNALSMLTAALKISPMESDVVAEPAALELRSRQQQHGGVPTQASEEAGPGQRPRDSPSAPRQETRPLPRRALGSGGRSGDPVLLESFLNAGVHATSAEVRGALIARVLHGCGHHVYVPALCRRAGISCSRRDICTMFTMSQPSGLRSTHSNEELWSGC